MAISATEKTIREGANYSANVIDVRALSTEVQTISDRVGQLTEVLITTKQVLASESGTHFILNATGAFVTTLPVLTFGLEYWFHIGATAPTTTHTVISDPIAKIAGNIATPDVDGTVVVVVPIADSINFIASKSLHGDFAHVWCDGSFWHLDGMCRAFDGMTTTT